MLRVIKERSMIVLIVFILSIALIGAALLYRLQMHDTFQQHTKLPYVLAH